MTTFRAWTLRGVPLALGLLTALAVVAPAHAGLLGGLLDGKIDSLVLEELAGGASFVNVIVETDGAPAPVAAFASALGIQVTHTYTLIDGFAGRAPAAALQVLATDGAVERIHYDQPVTPVMDVSHRAIEAHKAWAAGYTGDGVTVAILDTGIDSLNPAFSGAIVSCVAILAGLELPECSDTQGHGTHVAGTVASRDPTLPGVAPEASLAIVRVLHFGGAGLSSDVIAGMQWVADNQNAVSPPIRVVNMSLGPSAPGCGDDTNPSAQAANALVDAGVFVAVAAGNSGHAGCTIDGAGAASKVATIAAVDDLETATQADDVIAGFSSGGTVAQGKPDVSFPGVNITSAAISGGLLVSTLSGTSMATPHAAGTAALVFEANPGWTPAQVKNRINGTAVKTSNTGAAWNPVYGHGLGNACRALGLSGCS